MLSKDEVRRIWCEIYAKSLTSEHCTETEVLMISIIQLHPELEWVLKDISAAIHQEFSIDCWESNPFLHFSLHLALTEQLKSDNLNDIHVLFSEVEALVDSRHEAEHVMLACLAASIANSRRNGKALDFEDYLNLLKRKIETLRS